MHQKRAGDAMKNVEGIKQYKERRIIELCDSD